MYRLYEVLESGKLTDTQELYFTVEEFETKAREHPFLYGGRKWKLMPDTEDIIDIDLAQHTEKGF